MASIERVGKGTWRVRWREGGRGSTRHSSPQVSSKKAAQDWADQLERRLAAEAPQPGMVLSVSELVEAWRVYLRRAGRTNRYVQDEPDRVAAALGDGLISDLTPGQIESLGKGKRGAVLAALRWGRKHLQISVRRECLELPPLQQRKKPKPDLMPDAVYDAIQVAADAISPSMGAIVHLVGTYGHRPQSLSQLPRSALDLSTDPARLTLVVKGGDIVRHPVLAATVARLQPLAEGHGSALLVSPWTGRPWKSGHEIAMVYRSAIGRSRWPAEPGVYALKRRAISTMLARGLDPATIASITGHRRPDVLLRHYARTNETMQERALEVLADGPSGGPPRVHGAPQAPGSAGDASA
jgi:hypothetical protein